MGPLGGWPRKIVAVLAVLMTVFAALMFLEVSSVSAPGGEASLSADTSPSSSETVTKEATAKPASAVPSNLPDSQATLFLRAPDTGREPTTTSTLADGQSASIRWDPSTDTPAFITGSIAPPVSGTREEEALAFFSVNKELFRMTDPAAELSVERQVTDEIGMIHLQMDQTYKGVPVFGSEMTVHFSPSNMIQVVNGNFLPGIDMSVDPATSTETAVGVALDDFKSPARSSEFEPAQLVVLPQGAKAVLTWKVTLVNDDPPARMVYFIDAQNGNIITRYDALESAKNRRTYTANYGTSLPGTLLITEGGSSGDSVAQAAHNNTGYTYDYYYNVFGRDSFNGSGATLTSSVHYSTGYNNAFWNGQQMVYGDGDGSVFSPLGNGLDVVAHELTHAVTQYTADLVYSYQSGALNESYSDVFGEMVENQTEGATDWLMGEDVYTPHTPGDALRSLSNPPVYGQPGHMDDYVDTSSDNGGVHTNSGIPNKAAYNVAVAIGKDKMQRIWYRTLTVYLNSGSQFSDARDASIQAATDLYGGISAEVTAVQNAFAAVGIGSGQASNQNARIEINHTYRGDLVVTLGVGDPNSPAWSTVVSNRSGGSSDNIYTTVDVSAAASYLPPTWQNRWFLKVYDAAAQDVGSIQKFTITDNGTTYTAADTPVAVNDFETVYSYVPTNTIPIESPFIEKWNALGGAPGNATDVAQTITGGKYQNFGNGRLYWNQSLDTVYWVHGSILTKYDQLGRENGTFGLPTSDEMDVTGVSGGRENDFTGGRIYWGPGVGSYSIISGAIATKFFNDGGPATYGIPTSDETDLAGGGRYQNMQRAILTWDGSANPAYAVVGGIMGKYKILGGPDGPYGVATSDEYGTIGVTGGRESDFAGGRIYWSASTGTFGLQGAFLDKYLEQGGPEANGLPTSDAYPSWSGYAQNMQKAYVTWDSSLGAHLVRGGVMVKYQMLGGPTGGLHLITNEEHGISGVPGSPEAVRADFQNGQVFWALATGSHTVNGGIYVKYLSVGGPTGPLGLPVSDEYSIPLRGGGMRIQFQHGFITWGALYGTWVDYR